MAGLAALMTRKKRDRRRELEMKLNKPEADPVNEIRLPLTGKEAQEALQKKAAHENIKRILQGKELLHQKSKSFDALSQVSYSENGDDPSDDGGSAYSMLYIGLILLCIGVVITFVGLGEKGFKTFELKLIGPVLCAVGLSGVIITIAQCMFPKVFRVPAFIHNKLKRNSARLRDSDKSNLMENGENHHNGHLEKHITPSKNGADINSPRVVLQSAKKTPRPRSTIPNYIGDSSEEEDLDKPRNGITNGNSKADSNKMPVNSSSETTQNNAQQPVEPSASQMAGKREAEAKMTTIHQNVAVENQKEGGNEEEIVLSPKSLLL